MAVAWLLLPVLARLSLSFSWSPERAKMKAEDGCDSHRPAKTWVFCYCFLQPGELRSFSAWNYKVLRDVPFVLVAEKAFSVGRRLSLQIKRANWLTERKRMQSPCVPVLSLYRGMQLCLAVIGRGLPLKLTLYQSTVVEGYNSNGQFLHFCFYFVLNCDRSKTLNFSWPSTEEAG